MNRFSIVSSVSLCMAALSAGAAWGQAQKAAPPKPPVPAGWSKVETLGFEMYLPSDWYEIDKQKVDPDRKWVGAWRYASPMAHQKVLIRVSPYAAGDLKKVYDKNDDRLEHRVSGLKPHAMQVLPKDEKGRDGVTASYIGLMEVVDRETKKVVGKDHVFIRIFQRRPDQGTQVTVTYAFAGRRVAEAEAFASKHIELITFYDPKLVRQVLAQQATPKAAPAPAAPAKGRPAPVPRRRR